MRSYQRLLKYAMYLLPALIALVAYTTLYDRLHQSPSCLTNCDDYTFNASRELQLNFNKLLNLVGIKPQLPSKRPVATTSTRLDLAFLQEKLATNLHNTLQHLSDTPSSSSLATLAARDVDTVADPVGLTQIIINPEEKPTITQPDSLTASINGFNPPIIIAAKPENTLSNINPNINIASPVNSIGLVGILPAITSNSSSKPNPVRAVQVGNEPQVSSVPLPNSLSLMIAGLMVLLLVNHHAKTSKEHF